AHKAREKNLELVFDIHPEVPRQLQGDSLRLGQVLTNLVGNAIKFTVSGEVLVKVNVVEKTSQQVALEFSVRDTGIGLSEAHLANLFQPFNQADSSTSRKYGGTGLGLTISQRLVNLMGGEIQAQSQLGQGSSFSFVISLTPLPDSDNERFAIPPELIGLQVLVADDHAAPRQFLKNTLEYFSFRVTLADSAQAALTCLESADPQQHFDLVLMDWSMPGELDGLEAIRRIKSHANLAATPALLLVNVDELSHQPAAVDPDSTLIKPIIRPQLIGAILQVLGHKTPEQNLPDQVAIAPRSANELRGRQVLLVEDNEINQLVVADMLKNLGMQVFIANDGEAAMQ
ncbi:MAG: ATP-binding protein, partial [Chloroflexi bacterium]|nr:ATP-binding protein [Chloroflexota bacterium]